MSYRLIKWVGDPAVLKSDGFGVANWKHENSRAYPLDMPMNVSADTERVLEQGTGGLSRTYAWTKRTTVGSNGHATWVLPVDERDAAIILRIAPTEFRDVTNVSDPSKVRSQPIILPPRR